jgi:ABC-type lipoprotein export system ATPase subunit
MDANAKTPTAATPALAVRNLRFRYAAGPWVVDIPEFTLAPGEQALLTGGSGLGKSTLLQLTCGLLDPAEGAIRIAGRDIHALRGGSRDQFRGRHIGMIFQTFNLLSGFTALENVLAALMFSAIPPREHRARALEALASLGLPDPDAPVDRLSVGQQQRTAVARAVVCNPELVLADEPTASLDPENTEAAMRLIQDTCKARGAALLCVSHDPAMADRFPRRLALRDLNRATAPTPAGAPA